MIKFHFRNNAMMTNIFSWFSHHVTELDKYYIVPKKSSLGQGGNGVVRKVKRISDNQFFALKRLDDSVKNNREKQLRFQDEIDTLVNCQDVDGVIPIVDSSKKELWYTMPLAEKIDAHITTLETKVKCVEQIAKTLVELHQKGYSHRDIKPENILFYNDRFVLCDFGLVDIPDNPHNLTRNSSRIGPMSTIAPEMKRIAKEADGKKADVYSLAKTLWILLTGIGKGFDGVYNYEDTSIALGSFRHLKGQHLMEIEELLVMATSNDPKNRPTMSEFLRILQKWEEIRLDAMKMSQSNWHFLLKRLFGEHVIPDHTSWEDIDHIVNVLQIVSRLPISCYLFFPEGENLNFVGIEGSSEPECLDIKTDFGIYRIKPKSLVFDKFSVSAWNYFLLLLDEQEIKVGDRVDEYSEEVVEDVPGNYVSAKGFAYGVYDYDTGEKLPNGAKKIVRCLKGKMLLVLKLGPYNFIHQVSDGRHNNCTSEQFREYVRTLSHVYSMKGYLSEATWKQLREIFINECPYSPQHKLETEQPVNQSYEENYVKNHFGEFDFTDIVGYAPQKNDNSSIEYVFHLEISDGWDFFTDVVKKEKYCLCSNGRILECSPFDGCVLKVYDDAVNFYRQIEEKLQSVVAGKVSAIDVPHFKVFLTKVGQPQHLFTKDEIKAAMLAADDRVDNILVIDGNGYARIIQDASLSKLYPVVHETWCSGNNYVGRYSHLYDLDSAYHYCLAKWYDYLKEGVGQPMDDYDGCFKSEDELIDELQEFYNI